MDFQITMDDQKKIEAGIREKYTGVAKNPEGQFMYPTGKKGLETLNYEKTLIDRLPDAVASSYCGVGNPYSLGKIHTGDQILDIGCGAGVEAILAAMMTGKTGNVVGIDIVPEMLARAETNLEMTALNNVIFKKASGENLPFPDDSFQVVISNGAINLIPDKESALTEILRVLKPGGRLMMADQVASGGIQKDIKARLASWFQ
ncbi:MAG: methyltransferase domain-containing protein [Deltaproteobacteria bacterium]|nr:methyltransferase domain-containing protein [Deltaproteobacteria bacterium]